MSVSRKNLRKGIAAAVLAAQVNIAGGNQNTKELLAPETQPENYLPIDDTTMKFWVSSPGKNSGAIA